MTGARKDKKQEIFTFSNLYNPTSDSGLDIGFDLADSVRMIVGVVSPLFTAMKSLRAKPERVMRVGEDHASAVIDVPQAGVPEFMGAIESVSIKLQAGFNDVMNRYVEAKRTEQAIRRTAFDKQMLRLNTLAWNAHQHGWELMMFPREDYRWRLESVDPRTLACTAPKERAEHLIVNARVLGAYENTPDGQQDLFMKDMVKWIVVIDNEVRQICHYTTRSQGQDINRGVTYLTAKVEGAIGDIPSVVGSIELNRVQDWMPDD